MDVDATLPTDDPPFDEDWIPIQGIYTKLSVDSLSKIMLQAPVKNQTTISLSGNSSEIAHQATVGNKSWAFNNCDDLPHPYMKVLLLQFVVVVFVPSRVFLSFLHRHAMKHALCLLTGW